MKTALAILITPVAYVFIVCVSLFRAIPMSYEASKRLFK